MELQGIGTRLHSLLDLGSDVGGEIDENSDFYNPDGIQEGECVFWLRLGVEGLAAWLVGNWLGDRCGVWVGGRQGRLWVLTSLFMFLYSCFHSAGDTVEVVKDSVFYSIPKSPKEGVHVKGAYVPFLHVSRYLRQAN